jgi:hypothetical protein
VQGWLFAELAHASKRAASGRAASGRAASGRAAPKDARHEDAALGEVVEAGRPDASRDVSPDGSTGEHPADDGDQLGLFSPVALLRADLERALGRGDFTAADEVRRQIEGEHGRGAVPDDLDGLEELLPCRWEEASLESLLDAWERARGTTTTRHRRLQVRRGFFARVAAVLPLAEVAARDLRFVEDLVAVASETGQLAEARAILRDALLAGREVAPLDVEDRTLRAVLADEGCPQRLACLGGPRRAWPVPPFTEAEAVALAASWTARVPEDEAARALAAWDCLRVLAAAPVLPEQLVRGARLSLKLLDPELHAEVMGRLT